MGNTRSEQEINLRKEWGETMTDTQLDKCKRMEKCKEEKDGSKKNFATCIDIDKANYDNMDSVERRDKLGEIKTPAVVNKYRNKYKKINWNA